jgi:hypothetical protein
MLYDLLHSVTVRRAISPVSGAGSDTASVSQIIDMQGYSACMFLGALGSIADADATFAVLVEDGDDSGLSDGAAVADSALLSQTAGTAPEAAAAFQFDSDNGVFKIAYYGIKRYVRVTLTPTNNTGAWLHSLVAVLYGARHNPAGVTQAP